MTKKHFEALARIVAEARGHVARGSLSDAESMRVYLANRIAHECSNQNPRFDYTRFLNACEVKS